MISRYDRPRPRFPFVTTALIAANLVAFWYELTLGEARLGGFLDLWGVVPRSVSAFFRGAETQPGVLVTPLTSMYLHVGVLHLATNMLYLWVFGSVVERSLGRSRYLAFYTGCGLVAAAAQVVAWNESATPAIGASGAIAGLLAAYLVLRPGATAAALAPVLFFSPSVDVPAVIMLGLWTLSLLLSALTAFGAEAGGNLAWVAHLGGFFGGLVLVLFFRPRRRRPYHW